MGVGGNLECEMNVWFETKGTWYWCEMRP